MCRSDRSGWGQALDHATATMGAPNAGGKRQPLATTPAANTRAGAAAAAGRTWRNMQPSRRGPSAQPTCGSSPLSTRPAGSSIVCMFSGGRNWGTAKAIRKRRNREATTTHSWREPAGLGCHIRTSPSRHPQAQAFRCPQPRLTCLMTISCGACCLDLTTANTATAATWVRAWGVSSNGGRQSEFAARDVGNASA